MLRALGLSRAELSILVCDDREIQRLNRAHRRKNKPTDVLAFAMREGEALPGPRDMLGDVVISLDTARRQAGEHKHTLWEEVTVLLAHGLLHLVGYDHRDDAEEAAMNEKAAELVRATRGAPARMRRSHVDKGGRGIAKSSKRDSAKTRTTRKK